MSIHVNDLSFGFPNQDNLFSEISIHLGAGKKASLIGDNGSGKSTLLKILSGSLTAVSGQISCSEPTYTVPQHFGQFNSLTIAEVLQLDQKLAALQAILHGSVETKDYEIVGDDWDIEERVKRLFRDWEIEHVALDTAFSTLSGGEKTKVFLAGIGLISPAVVLMDEPTNHLDRNSRSKLYDLITHTPATMLIVSHDRELLNRLEITLELTSVGINRYGGNYAFYKAQREEHAQALLANMQEMQKAIRTARITARQATERKEKADARGKKKHQQAGIPRIMMNSLRDGAEKSSTKLKDTLSEKVNRKKEELSSLKNELPDRSLIRIAVHDSDLHRGKILVEARGVNFGYTDSENLWKAPLDFHVLSGERVQLTGGNGSGKTTLIRLITAALRPCYGELKIAPFQSVYLDQEYALIDNNLDVFSQLERYNVRLLPEHELKTELHRFLFLKDSWDKPCWQLSGGEKMRLMLCCLLISDNTPDVFILDEPTNNLDITSMEILTEVMSTFQGTILLISHDWQFAADIGIERTIHLSR